MPFATPRGSASTTSSNGAPGGRTTFRPPWVKDDGGVNSLKPTTKTSVPWAKKGSIDKENGDKPENATKTTTSTTGNGKATGLGKKPTNQTAAKTSDSSTPNSTKKSTEATSNAKKIAEPVKKTVDTPAKKIVEPAKKTIEPSKKLVEPVKKVVEPAKKVVEPVKKFTTPAKKTPEPTNKSSLTPAKTTIPTRSALKKKEPTPPSSSEEETEEEETEEEETEEEETEEEETEEEESEEEEEDDDEDDEPEPIKVTANKFGQLKSTQRPNAKVEEESELKRRFSIEKPKLRPVVVKRDKSMKKVEDDEEAEEGETEEERERRLRFKLEKPKLRHVKREEKPLPSKSTDNILKIRPVLKKVSKVDELLKEPKEEPKPEFKTKTLRKTPSIKRDMSIKNVPAPPPLPSLVPKAPPPPPPPLGAPGVKSDLNEKQKAALDKLKSRPRRRPDWSEMMKEVESGRKLKHVECNDRSQPILTCKSMTKVDDKFIYETEKDNSHNKLLKQIQSGVRLKPTQTNDRSKPFIEGLRKFRRQMTIEEQLQKSQSKINMLAAVVASAEPGKSGEPLAVASNIVAALSIDESSGDELDDIDSIRDDLQSTKQMLALELRNREAQERENKKLLAKISTLEAELVREKSRAKNLEYGSNVIVATMDATPASEAAYVKSLKKEAEDARHTTKDLEQKYLDTGELLDLAKTEIEEQKRQIQLLERKLAAALLENTTPPNNLKQFNFCFSDEDPDDINAYYASDITKGETFNGSRRASEAFGRDSSPEIEPESESDPDEPEEKKIERREKRAGKDVKVLRSKLTKLKVREEAAKKEKQVLKQAMKKNHISLKEENKKFKKLEKEVQKMAASLKDEEEDENDDEEKDEDEDEKEPQQSEEEEESDDESDESESEESDAATESESEGEDAANTDKKKNLEPRVKKHEGRLTAMKKCNVLLQANVDNLQDEITQVRSKSSNLQAELDAVLADLGF